MKSIVYCCLLLLASTIARADCCDHCHCDNNCCKVCRLVCETKTVVKPEYDCECEDFCVPGKSECCVVCDECGNKKKVFTPTCGCVRTRVKLVKKEKKEQVTVYKCVVENLCPGCSQKCGAKPLPTSAVAGYFERMRDATDKLTPASHTEPLPAQTLAPATVPQPGADFQPSAEAPSFWQRTIAPLVKSEVNEVNPQNGIRTGSRPCSATRAASLKRAFRS